jgi:hypothetical protein
MRIHLAAAATALALQLSAAHAETAVALIGEDLLATVDTSSGKTTGFTKIEGVGPVLGLDVRPADGQLYALTTDGTIATIDPRSGQATVKSKLDTPLSEGVDVSVDFNPVADRLRIIGTDGVNLRANVDDGKVTRDQPLKFAETDPANGQTPSVIAAGYANSVKGAKETTLYDIDGSLGVLFRQVPPNDGILNTIGKIGIDAPSVGFDIVTDASGANVAMLVAKGTLYTLDLTSGKATPGRKIAGLPTDVRDIAVLPAMGMKRAADAKGADGMTAKPGADMTAGYLPKDMPAAMAAPKPMTQTGASPDLKGGKDAKSTSRMAYGGQQDAYSARKAKRSLQCDRDGKQY